MNDWLDWLFWVAFAGMGVFAITTIVKDLLYSWRFNRLWHAAPPSRTTHTQSEDSDSWSLMSATSGDTSSGN